MDIDYDKIKKIAVSNRILSGVSYFQKIKGLTKEGAGALILREKDLTPEEYFRLADEVRDHITDISMPIILHTGINHTNKIQVIQQLTDYIAAHELAGIHFTEQDFRLYCKNGRPMNFGKEKIIGVSIHSVEEAKSAEALGADYVIAGHIFETGCKPGIQPRGLRFLQSVCEQVSIPVYAIGGITKENAALTIQSGAAGICIMSGYFKA